MLFVFRQNLEYSFSASGLLIFFDDVILLRR